MPPIHCWEDKMSKKRIEVLRKIGEHDAPPTLQEVADSGILDGLDHEPEWTKVISRVAVKKGYRWGGGKGNW